MTASDAGIGSAPDAAPGVAYDVTPLVGPRTGIGYFAAELFRALDASGRTRLLPYVLSRRADVERDPVPPGTRRLALPANLAVRLWGRLGGPALDGALGPASVVHGTNYVAPPSRRAAVVVTVHDCAFARFPGLCTAEAREAGRLAARLAQRGAWVHTPSAFVAAEVRELFGTARVRAIPHGVPRLAEASEPPVPTADRSRPYLLALGTIEPRKRHADLVVAFGHLARQQPDLELVLAGSDGPARPEVEQALAALDPSTRSRVRLVGRVEDGARAALLRSAAALVSCSLYEGFGLPIVEAMASGTPVVTTPAGGVEEVADGAAVIASGGPEALASAVERVLTDTALRHRLVDAGLERAGRFRWDETAARMEALYEEAIRG